MRAKFAARERIAELEKLNERLLRELEELRRHNERLEKEKEELRREREQLKKELELARRARKRQAAPFSKGPPKSEPKTPGRKAGPGYGRKAHRLVPEQIDEEIEVPLPEQCPKCGGRCQGEDWDDQYQSEIIRQTKVTHFRIAVGHCRDCGARVQGRDGRQTSDALGAAASQLGAEALSLATVLNKELGLPYGKTAAVLEQGFGLKVTRGGVCQALARIGAKCEPTYEDLSADVRSSVSVTMDETGWKVGGDSWWLWTAVNEDTTIYGILPGRGYAEAARLLGADFAGIIVHDGWRAYYGFKSAFHQSCQGHLINRCSEMITGATAGGAVFPMTIKELLQQGLTLRDRFAEELISSHGLAVATGRLEARLDRLLDKHYRLPENERLAKHLDHEFDYLFNYLRCPGLEATNWRGEQAIRPAVVTRKVWGGNRNENGAHTQEVLTSVLRTAHQRNVDPVPLLADLVRSPYPYVLHLPRTPAPT